MMLTEINIILLDGTRCTTNVVIVFTTKIINSTAQIIMIHNTTRIIIEAGTLKEIIENIIVIRAVANLSMKEIIITLDLDMMIDVVASVGTMTREIHHDFGCLIRVFHHH